MSKSHSRVLIITNNAYLRSRLGRTLDQWQFDFSQVANGESALVQLRAVAYEAVLMDLSMSGLEGIAVCRQLRQTYPRLAVLVISKSRSPAKVVSTLDAGADDYLIRPFGLRELIARLRSVLRRFRTPTMESAYRLKIGRIVLDRSRHRVENAGREVSLTPTEFLTLRTLMENAGTLVKHEILLTAIWGQKRVHHQENLRVIMSTLRKKLGDNHSDPAYLTTHKTLGYSFRASSNDLA